MAVIDEEIELLKRELKRLDKSGGSPDGGGIASVPFGVLVRDDRCSNIFEALVGTLKAAKKRKVVRYDSELLLQGVHDKVDVVLLQD